MWIKSVLCKFSSIFKALFGQIHWTPPHWISVPANKIRSEKKLRTVILCLVIVPIVLFGYHYFTRVPENQLVVINVTKPSITPNYKKLKPSPLMLHFKYNGPSNRYASAAPLSMIGKHVEQGIHIYPATAGTWRWNDARTLSFLPKSDWPAGQSFTIKFDKSVFNQQTQLKQYSAEFTTHPFIAKIIKAYFYQNPKDPTKHQVVATLNFNYPVDEVSLKKYTRLQLLTQSNRFVPFSYRFDKNKRVAYLRSNQLQLPDKAANLKVEIEKGVKPKHGPSTTKNNISIKVAVPDKSSVFKIIQLQSAVVRKEDNTPQKILRIGASIGVNQDELMSHLTVYLLPERKFNSVYRTYDINPLLLAQSKRLQLKPIKSALVDGVLHQFVYKAPGKRSIYVSIDANLVGNGHYRLPLPYNKIIRVPAYPTELRFQHKGSLLALAGNKYLTLATRGLTSVKIHVNRVLGQDINHLITQTSGDISNPNFRNYYFNENNITEGFNEIRPIYTKDKAKLEYFTVALSRYLPKSEDVNKRLGLFFVSVVGMDPKNSMAIGNTIKRLVLVTNMTMLVKDNTNGTHDVFVSSVIDGKPVENAKVTVIGKNGLPLLERITDDQGHVIIPTLNDYINEKQPTAYVVRHARDVSFMPYQRYDRRLNYSRYNVGGQYDPLAPDDLRAFVFSNRGLYRPGDKIHIGSIVKKNNWSQALKGLPLEVRITNPRGARVLTKAVPLMEDGIIDDLYKTEERAPTGRYHYELYLRHAGSYAKLLGSTSVQVEEFQPDTMKIKSIIEPHVIQGWLAPDKVKAKVALTNLYGMPATQRKIRANINLNPRGIYFSQFPGFHFRDPLQDKKRMKYYHEQLPAQMTDANGQATFNLKLDRFNKASYYLSFYAEGFAAGGGRSVTTQSKTVLVSPLHYMLGYKANGNLRYIKQNDVREVKVIAVDPRLAQINLSPLKLKLYQRVNVAVLAQRSDGSYFYNTKQKKILRDEKTFAVAKAGSQLTIPSDKLGDYTMELTDSSKNLLAEFAFSIVGEGVTTAPKNAELSLKLDKNTYKPGSDIEVQIRAPYAGTGLISIERDKVYAYQWFKMKTNTTLQKIHLPAHIEGNAYIVVSFIRDFHSDEKFMDPLSYAVAPFSIGKEKHTVNIDVKAPDKTEPGSDMAIQYKTDKPAKLILFGADEGILQVANYVTPNPLSYFFTKLALRVITYQTADLILPNEPLYENHSTIGGGYGLDRAAMGANGRGASGFKFAAEAKVMKQKSQLNPFKRKVKKPVTFWSGLLDADNTYKEYHFHAPSYFNGTMRVMAIAIDQDAVGSVATNALVRGDFIITPNVPTFLAPGDSTIVSVTVANQLKGSGAEAKIDVGLTVNDKLSIDGVSSNTINIPEGTEKTVIFKVKANKALGVGELTFSAATANKRSQYHSSLSVRPVTTYQTILKTGLSQNSTHQVDLSPIFHKPYSVTLAAAANSPLVLVHGLKPYLEKYPYGCTEQMISKALPIVALAKYPSLNSSPMNVYRTIEKTIKMLKQRQIASGGFKFWPGASNQADRAVSLYAIHFLTLAKERGYSIDSTFYKRQLRYLETLAALPNNNLNDTRAHAEAIYLLARNEKVVTNLMTNIIDDLQKESLSGWRKDLTAVYIAATYRLMQRPAMADKILSGYELKDVPHRSEDPLQQQLSFNARYIDVLANHFPKHLKQLPLTQLVQIIKPVAEGRYNTLSLAYAILALADYSKLSPSSSTAVNIYAINDKLERGPALKSARGVLGKVVIPYVTKTVEFADPNHQDMFYQVSQAGFPYLDKTSSYSHDIEVYREYQNKQNKVIHKAKLGDDVQVKLHIRATDKFYHDHMVIVDLLPAGFEVDRKSINRSVCNYVDIREDRVLFFLSVDSNPRTLHYKIKAINSGEYMVPPAYAESMYELNVSAQGKPEYFSVK